MVLAPGTRLGVYEVTAQIGAGGMGEVYKATDSNLKRAVAIKVLPASVASDVDRLARLQREAEVLASLNHPNIAAIYGLETGQAGSAFPFLVMELVEGEDLSQRIARGAIPIDEALAIAKQIADALEGAHEQNIVHRDLKPANIKVRPDGTVKVLDFGLAKAMAPDGAAAASASMSPTITTPAMTQAGMILGTAAYMSPEQARGKAVDRRADIWAFGAVLFEMLTGTRAFPGEDITDTLAAVVRAEPEWSLVPKAISPTLLLFLRRSLQKDPKQRVGDIRDLRLAIEGAFEAPSAPATPVVAPVVSRRRERVAWAAALGVVSLAALALAAFTYVRPAPADVRPTRFFVSPPDGWRVTTSMASGLPAGALAVSPDGSRVAFLASAATGRSRLWVRALDTLTAQELPGTDGAVAPFWSPDSRFLAFFADGKLKKIAVSGGPAVPLCDVGTIPTGGTWSQDGVIVFGPNNSSALQRVSASGGVPTAATVFGQGDTLHARPSFLPDGRHFIYRVGSGGLYVTSLDSTARTLLLEDPVSTNVVYSRGHLLFLRDTTLMAQPFDLGRLALGGEPVPIADQVLRLNTGANSPADGVFSASDAGVLVYQTGAVASRDRQLTWFDRTGKVLGLVEKPGQYNTVAISPDGTRAAISRDDAQAAGRGAGQLGNTDLWVHEFARGTSTRLTFDAARDWMAAWSPDGSRIAWGSTRDGNNDSLYQKLANGAGSDEALFKSSDAKYPYDWSPDGRFLLYAVGVTGGRRQLWGLPLTGDDRPSTNSGRPEPAEGRKPTPYLQTDFDTSQARFSPDGRFVAYASNASGKTEVYVQPFPSAASGKWMVSQGGGAQPHWRRDGKELFYISADSKMMAVPVATTSAFAPGVPKALFAAPIWGGGATVNVTRYDVTADGQKFLITVLPQEATAAAPAPITVVLNWAAGLKP